MPIKGKPVWLNGGPTTRLDYVIWACLVMGVIIVGLVGCIVTRALS